MVPRQVTTSNKSRRSAACWWMLHSCSKAQSQQLVPCLSRLTFTPLPWKNKSSLLTAGLPHTIFCTPYLHRQRTVPGPGTRDCTQWVPGTVGWTLENFSSSHNARRVKVAACSALHTWLLVSSSKSCVLNQIAWAWQRDVIPCIQNPEYIWLHTQSKYHQYCIQCPKLPDVESPAFVGLKITCKSSELCYTQFKSKKVHMWTRVQVQTICLPKLYHTLSAVCVTCAFWRVLKKNLLSYGRD